MLPILYYQHKIFASLCNFNKSVHTSKIENCSWLNGCITVCHCNPILLLFTFQLYLTLIYEDLIMLKKLIHPAMFSFMFMFSNQTLKMHLIKGMLLRSLLDLYTRTLP